MSNVSKRVLNGSIAALLLLSILLIMLGLCLILWPQIVVQVLRWVVALACLFFGLYTLIHICAHALR